CREEMEGKREEEKQKASKQKARKAESQKSRKPERKEGRENEESRNIGKEGAIQNPITPSLHHSITPSLYACGWSLKKLHRLIMLSSTYRQSGQFDPKAGERDAEDRYLWRYAPRRLEAEAVRDAMLA